jgi:hypothetical protein
MICIEPAVASLWSSNKTTAGLYVGSEEFVFSVSARWAGLLDDDGAPAMVPGSVGSTDPNLLNRVAALWDNPAWAEFIQRYDPLVIGWCAAYGFDTASADELRQRVWRLRGVSLAASRCQPLLFVCALTLGSTAV